MKWQTEVSFILGTSIQRENIIDVREEKNDFALSRGDEGAWWVKLLIESNNRVNAINKVHAYMSNGKLRANLYCPCCIIVVYEEFVIKRENYR